MMCMSTCTPDAQPQNRGLESKAQAKTTARGTVPELLVVPDKFGGVGEGLHRCQEPELAVVVADRHRHGFAVEPVLGLNHQRAKLAAKHIGHLVGMGRGFAGFGVPTSGAVNRRERRGGLLLCLLCGEAPSNKPLLRYRTHQHEGLEERPPAVSKRRMGCVSSYAPGRRSSVSRET